MKIQILKDVDPAEWNKNVSRFGGCCFHSYEWSRFSAETNNAEPIYVRIYDENNSIDSLAWGLISFKKVAGYTLLKTLSFGSLPAINKPDQMEKWVDKIKIHAHKNAVSLISLYSFGTPFNTDFLRNFSSDISRRWEFVLNIRGNEEELWKKIHSKKRNMIRKGKKSGLQIKQAQKLSDLLEYRKLAIKTWKRKKSQGIAFPPVANESYFKIFKNELIDRKIGRLYLAYKVKKPVAGAFFVGFNSKAYYILSSTSNEGLKMSAPDLILWTSMTDYQNENYNEFNLGGLSENELNGQPLEKSGLYHFKRRFSAEVFPCYKANIIIKPFNYSLYQMLHKLKTEYL